MSRERSEENRVRLLTTHAETGIALVMVLWVLTILMVIVLSFSFTTRTETQATLSFKEMTENKFLAEAGIERAITEIAFRRVNPVAEDVWKIDGTPYTDQLGKGTYRVRILDESGKVDINITSDIILKTLLGNFGIQGEEADTLVDSIMDWKDPDDLLRLHGAENAYYQSLPVPYKAKNAPFDTMEELLLVRGMTPAMLYGTGQKGGLIDYLTVHARTAININTAAKEVLTAVPGITPEIADMIITYRQNKRITNFQEVGIPPQSAPYITTAIEGNAYTIEATGYTVSENKGYSIRATVSPGSTGKYTFVYYKSPVFLQR